MIALLLSQMIMLNSIDGQKLFAQAQAKQDFFALSATFEQQESQSFCGVAASVAVLNAMPLQAPEVAGGYRAFTQANVFDASAREAIAKGGVTLEQLTALLNAQGVDARGTHANTATLAEFRTMAAANLARANDYVLVDFFRTTLGQDFGAHWSPLGAYDAASDRFLILDVNRRRYPPYWVTAADLFAAMNTFDPDAARTRGWIEVRSRPGAPLRTPAPKIKGKLLTFAIAAVVLIFSLGFAAGRISKRKAASSQSQS